MWGSDHRVKRDCKDEKSSVWSVWNPHTNTWKILIESESQYESERRQSVLHKDCGTLPKAVATRAIFCLRWWCKFFEIVASPARGENRLCSHPLTKSVFLSQKIQLIEFLAIFFCHFFICRITCARVATHAIFSARWWRDNFQKKLHHHRKQKIARVAAA